MGWDGVSGDLQIRANSVSQIDRISDVAPAYQLCGSVVGGFRTGTVSSGSEKKQGLARLSAWEKADPHLST